jgi:fructuronate reductase
VSAQALTRTAVGITPAPVRIVHLGIGAFHRAHQAWYTARADDADAWGIAAFTGRRPDQADMLRPQDGLYTMVERNRDGDRFEIITSLSSVHSGTEVERFMRVVTARETAVITMTVTEAAYLLGRDGALLDAHPDVVGDLRALASGIRHSKTPLGRLTLALRQRWIEHGTPLAVVPCDNIPDNGPLVRAAVLQFAAAVSPDFVGWINRNVSFVSTSVDRITPRVTPELSATVREATGWLDAAPVVTEPFSDWTLCGEFPMGRPAWETAGARFVEKITPYESRKLWLLNGAHTALACSGLLRGHTTVAQAMADGACRGLVERFWQEAARHLPSETDAEAYCASLRTRFENPRVEHLLAQIALDSDTKVALRIVPVATHELDAGRDAEACADVIGAYLRLSSQGAAGLRPSNLIEVDERLADDAGFEARVLAVVS